MIGPTKEMELTTQRRKTVLAKVIAMTMSPRVTYASALVMIPVMRTFRLSTPILMIGAMSLRRATQTMHATPVARPNIVSRHSNQTRNHTTMNSRTCFLQHRKDAGMQTIRIASLFAPHLLYVSSYPIRYRKSQVHVRKPCAGHRGRAETYEGCWQARWFPHHGQNVPRVSCIIFQFPITCTFSKPAVCTPSICMLRF